MATKIKLNESQLKYIISSIISEERRKFFKPKQEMSPAHKEELIKVFDEFGTSNPRLLYPKLIEYHDTLFDRGASPDKLLDISYIIGLLELYYDVKEGPDPQNRVRRPRVEPEKLEKGVTYIPQEKEKFADRFKFKRGDIM